MEKKEASSQEPLPRAVEANTLTLAEASDYIHAATSENTRLAYQSDIEHFLAQGHPLPATPEAVERYLKTCAAGYNPRTLIRRVTALRQWHKLKGIEDTTQSPLVAKTMRGIARLHGRPKKQAVALRLKDLDQLITHLKENDSLKNTRDRALLLVGFFWGVSPFGIGFAHLGTSIVRRRRSDYHLATLQDRSNGRRGALRNPVL